jgi:hypothetical protein
MDIGTSSRFLAQMTIRRPRGRTLDLGTGCGVQAFLAAAHSDQVVAVDANARAVNCAAFNAQLNGRANVVCLEGDLFEPVQGQAFDLIVCNPPFVIGPRSDYVHTDSGRPLDEMCRTIAGTVPLLLREGGYGQLLCNWVHVKGQDWRERLAGWFAGSGCDVLILHADPQDAAAYAAERIAERGDDTGGLGRPFDEWLAYFERENIEAVGTGVISLRRSVRSTNRVRWERMPELRGACGEAIARAFERQDFLEEHGDNSALLEARLRPAAELRWEQELAYSSEGWSGVHSRFRLEEGLAFVSNAAFDVVEFVSRCAGRRLGDVLRELPAPPGQDVGTLIAARLRVVRRLVEVGYLVPDVPSVK